MARETRQTNGRPPRTLAVTRATAKVGFDSTGQVSSVLKGHSKTTVTVILTWRLQWCPWLGDVPGLRNTRRIGYGHCVNCRLSRVPGVAHQRMSCGLDWRVIARRSARAAREKENVLSKPIWPLFSLAAQSSINAPSLLVHIVNLAQAEAWHAVLPTWHPIVTWTQRQVTFRQVKLSSK